MRSSRPEDDRQGGPLRRPFAHASEVAVVLHAGPGDHAAEDLAALLRAEAHELAVELGAPVRICDTDPGTGPRLLLQTTDHPEAVARLDHDPAADLLLAEAPSLAAMGEALSLLRTLVTTGARAVAATPCRGVEAALGRVEHEVATTYPAFELRDLDWAEICSRHRQAVLDAAGGVHAFQRWTAELGDAHTSVSAEPPDGLLPYTARAVAGRVRFHEVTPGTPAADGGVGTGDVLENVDVGDLWSRVGAPAHLRPWLVGRRALGGPVGEPRTYDVRRRDGSRTSFQDIPAVQPWPAPVTWERLPSGTGYLRIRAWPPRCGDLFEEALAVLAGCERLLVDLRGNPGGALVEAVSLRSRFLERATTLGSVRYSVGDGSLSRPFPVSGEPSSGRRWRRRARFLVDALTCSASEDALLGLRQFPHVDVVGSPTGGGSGRPRRLPLLPGMRLSVSTALTYDHDGRCIEGSGVAVDRHLDAGAPDAPLTLADRSW